MVYDRYRRTMSSRLFTRVVYWLWIFFPYFLRKPLTALGLLWILGMKKVFRVNQRDEMTPTEKLGNLSFWGVPEVDLDDYRLRVGGLCDNELELDFEAILARPAVERPTRMDCVGGFRNNSVMKGFLLADLVSESSPMPGAETAVFRCADDYFTTSRLSDLESAEALLVYEINGERLARFGSPLRLAIPGLYGYKWAKWITDIDIVGGFPPGYWEKRGLPKRGRVGDIW